MARRDKLQIKDYLRESNLIHSRLVVMFVALMLLALALISRVWYLQIHDFERFNTLSQDNRIRLIPSPPVRGRIFDRNGKILAENLPVYTLEILPADVPDMEALIAEMSEFIELSDYELKRFRSQVRYRPSFEVQALKLNLSEQEVARFVVNQHRYQGAQIQARLQRYYPYADELAHVVGYVGRINQKEVDTIDQEAYRGTKYIGKLGIEQKYEKELLGKVGYKQAETNAHGRIIRMVKEEQPTAGKDIHLNIDIDLQIAARKFLEPYRGSVIAIEPDTGAVLAFVSNPVYDPNKFVNGIDHESYNALRDDPSRPLLNRALYGRYAPGSTIKGLLGLLALENDWRDDNTVYCPGWYSLKGSKHRYRCWRRQGHGQTTILSAITRSCDVFFYHLAQSLGIDKMHAFLTRFGLGNKTGIDLNFEPSGLVPSKEWKRKVKNVIWYPGETVITGIGQGYMLTTPLQLGVMAATLATNGQRKEPRLVQKLVDAESGVMQSVSGPIVDNIELASADYYQQIIQAMRAVMEDEHGTARSSGLNASYSIAGKTGTAQVVAIAQGAEYDETKLSEFNRDHGLFIAFAPVENPAIAIAVIVENAGSGSKSAAPIARKIMDAYLLNKLNQLASKPSVQELTRQEPIE